ncbi:hypothetical protein Q9L58_010241 [Maublancomyces gigas]|uniref:Uncharacterized protein n=1 Tax=Discina gigas TaxID=1032678 RepID=A0ABR3G4Q8_9PEZI
MSTFEKKLTNRLAKAGKINGAITKELMESPANRFAIDSLMLKLTTVQEWLRQKSKSNKASQGQDPSRPSFIANDINGVFNCVIHAHLIAMLPHYRFPERIVGNIADFNSNRKISMAFDGKQEAPCEFYSGLPQGFPLSPHTVHHICRCPELHDPQPQPPRSNILC